MREQQQLLQEKQKKIQETSHLWKGNDYSGASSHYKQQNGEEEVEIKHIKIVIKNNIQDQINEITKKMFIMEGKKAKGNHYQKDLQSKEQIRQQE